MNWTAVEKWWYIPDNGLEKGMTEDQEKGKEAIKSWSNEPEVKATIDDTTARGVGIRDKFSGQEKWVRKYTKEENDARMNYAKENGYGARFDYKTGNVVIFDIETKKIIDVDVPVPVGEQPQEEQTEVTETSQEVEEQVADDSYESSNASSYSEQESSYEQQDPTKVSFSELATIQNVLDRFKWAERWENWYIIIGEVAYIPIKWPTFAKLEPAIWVRPWHNHDIHYKGEYYNQNDEGWFEKYDSDVTVSSETSHIIPETLMFSISETVKSAAEKAWWRVTPDWLIETEFWNYIPVIDWASKRLAPTGISLVNNLWMSIYINGKEAYRADIGGWYRPVENRDNSYWGQQSNDGIWYWDGIWDYDWF